MAGALKRKRRAENHQRGGLEGGWRRDSPAAVHAPVIAAPAMTVMAIPAMMILVMIPIDWRQIALAGGNRAVERRNRRGLRGARNGHHQRRYDRHRKDSPCHFHSPCSSAPARTCASA